MVHRSVIREFDLPSYQADAAQRGQEPAKQPGHLLNILIEGFTFVSGYQVGG